jgi:hypothetical protein
MPKENEAFLREFCEIFYSGQPEEYASAGITSGELRTLRNLYIEAMHSLFGEGTRIGSLTRVDKETIRTLVVTKIIEEGWPQPEEIEAHDLAIAALFHGCQVAEMAH